MAEPRFSSAIAPPGARAGDDVSLTDVSGIALARRFEGSATPGTARREGDVLEWSVSPGEWTVAGDGTADGDVDLTHVRAVFRLTGDLARSVLAKVCSLDLADDMFPTGAAARTTVAGVATELVRDDGEEVSYLLLPSRSFAGFVWGVLVDAGVEFDL